MPFATFIRRIITLVGSSMILLFFSEFYFLNEGPVETIVETMAASPWQLIPAFLEFTLFYMLFTYIFFLALNHFQVKTLMGLFLAGALFGWATEGVIIPIVYEAIPFSFLFPSVTWHAMVDVVLGWYLIRLLMRKHNPLLSIAMFAILGAAWGAWGTWFWGEAETPAPLTPSVFTQYVWVTSMVWVFGMIIMDRFGTVVFTPSRWEIGIVLGVVGILAAMMAIAVLPLSLLLIPLIGWTLAALRRLSGREDQAILAPLEVYPRWWQYPLALLMPLTASLVYPFFYESGTGIPTEDVLFVLIIVSGVMFAVGVVRPFLPGRQDKVTGPSVIEPS
jgi:hypothetical protein